MWKYFLNGIDSATPWEGRGLFYIYILYFYGSIQFKMFFLFHSCAINKGNDRRVVWSLNKLYLHKRHFLYKLDYNSKWNTQEKIPTNIKSRRSKLIKGGAQSSKGQWNNDWKGAGLLTMMERFQRK